MLPRGLVLRRRVVPLEYKQGILVIGVEGDPDDFELLAELQFICNQNVRLVPATGVAGAIQRYYSNE
jgi:hypothetical protein